MFRVERFTNAQGIPLDQLHFHNFPPGSIVVVSVRLTEIQEKALSSLHELMRSQVFCLASERLFYRETLIMMKPTLI